MIEGDPILSFVVVAVIFTVITLGSLFFSWGKPPKKLR